jgi:serine O-acetyltransferase
LGLTRWLTGIVYIFAKLASDILTNCDISRHAVIGEDFMIIKCGPLYIDDGVVIGDRCVVMHNVTIGKCITDDAPVLRNDVFIAAGVTVVGDVEMADFAKATSNALVIDDVPAHTVVAGVPAKAFADPSVFKKLKEQRDAKKAAAAKATATPEPTDASEATGIDAPSETTIEQPQTP